MLPCKCDMWQLEIISFSSAERREMLLFHCSSGVDKFWRQIRGWIQRESRGRSMKGPQGQVRLDAPGVASGVFHTRCIGDDVPVTKQGLMHTGCRRSECTASECPVPVSHWVRRGIITSLAGDEQACSSWFAVWCPQTAKFQTTCSETFGAKILGCSSAGKQWGRQCNVWKIQRSLQNIQCRYSVLERYDHTEKTATLLYYLDTKQFDQIFSLCVANMTFLVQ